MCNIVVQLHFSISTGISLLCVFPKINKKRQHILLYKTFNVHSLFDNAPYTMIQKIYIVKKEKNVYKCNTRVFVKSFVTHRLCTVHNIIKKDVI